MYAADSETTKDSLRQGDILSGILVMGAINVQGVNFVSAADGTRVGWTVPTKPELADVAVLSHSCEVDRKNGVKVTSIVVAPVRDIHTATDPGKVAELRQSNFIKKGTDASFLKYFYLEANDRLQHSAGAVVDFSKCYSIRKNAYEHLVKQKVAELAKEAREAFSLKLALYFHRNEKPAATTAAS